MGVHLFAGKFYECIDPTRGERFPVREVSNRNQCESLFFNESMPWENAKLNFDNVGNGFLSLLQVVSMFLISLSVICSSISWVNIRTKCGRLIELVINYFSYYLLADTYYEQISSFGEMKEFQLILEMAVEVK